LVTERFSIIDVVFIKEILTTLELQYGIFTLFLSQCIMFGLLVRKLDLYSKLVSIVKGFNILIIALPMIWNKKHLLLKILLMH
jgi:hypothetical protein